MPLPPPRRPKVLVVALELHWPAAARLPRALQDAGFEVGVACRPAAFLAATRFRDQIFPLPESSDGDKLFACLASIAESWEPELVIPVDDRTALFLAGAHAHAFTRKRHRALAARLRFSQGNPAALPQATSKRATLDLARQLGVRAPASRTVTSLRDVMAFNAEHPFPIVLKQSYSCGGNGVFICQNEREAGMALTNLLWADRPQVRFRAWRGGLRGRVLSRHWLPTDRSIVACQFIAGKNATSLTAACEGETLAALTAEVVESYPNAKGPSSVVRFIHHEEMRRASASLVRHWGLTGLIGFDFILDANDAAWLLECNPRPTPIAHLGARAGADLCLALRERLVSGSPSSQPDHPAGLMVAFFPFETWRDPKSPHLVTAHYDIPSDDSELLERLTNARPWAQLSSTRPRSRLTTLKNDLLTSKSWARWRRLRGAIAGSPVVRRIARPLAAFRRRIFPPKISLVKIEGLEAGSRLPLSILCGMTAQEKSYLLGLAFAEQPGERDAGRVRLKQIFEDRVDQAEGCSMIAIRSAEYKLTSVRRTGNWFIIPVWVRGEVKIPLPTNVLAHESVRADLRKIRQHEFEYEITRDPGRFDDFYYNMHAPLIRKAHGDAAHLQPYAEAWQQPGTYDLLMVRKKSRPDRDIAGVVIIYEKTGPRLLILGVRDDGADYVREGVTSALYHFSFEHLTAKGFSCVRTGGAHAFLRDGLLRYKRKLSQALIEPSWESIALKILSFTPATKAFLQNNPFIHESGGALHAAIFTDSPLSPEAIRKYNKDFFHPGLAKLVIHTFRPDESFRLDGLAPELVERFEIRPAHELLENEPPGA